MMRDPNGKKKNLFERFSNWATNATGSSAAFSIAALTVVIWAVTGPVFKYAETWQLVINTDTTIVTFDGFPDSEIAEQRFQGDPFKTEREVGFTRRHQ